MPACDTDDDSVGAALQLFAEVTYEGRRFNKLVVLDEARKYIESPDLVAGLDQVVREMRHKGTSAVSLAVTQYGGATETAVKG